MSRMDQYCERCGRVSSSLIPIDYAHASVQYTEMMGEPYTGTDQVCLDCARTVLEISAKDLIPEERRRAREMAFLARGLRSRVAVAVVETVLQGFGYEVYPYTLENQMAGVIRAMRQREPGYPVRMLGASPDLYVFDRERSEGLLVEVLDGEVPDGRRFWTSRFSLSALRGRWPEAVLAVVCTPGLELFSRIAGELPVESLSVEQSPLTGRFHCALELGRDLRGPGQAFRLIDPKRYPELLAEIRGAVARSVATHGGQ